MKVFVLASGSKGNSIYLESKETSILIDAGISGKMAAERLARHGRSMQDVDAVLISHDHADHVKSAGVYHRKFNLPVYITPKTLEKATHRHRLGDVLTPSFFSPGDRFSLGTLSLETIPTPHDGVDGVSFIVDDGKHRIGVLTDLGHVFGDLLPALQSLDGVVLESNHDEHMLQNGPYPEQLKRRIRGRGGHISNREAAELVARSGKKLKWVCLAHLSEENNLVSLAAETFEEVNRRERLLWIATQKGELLQPERAAS
jgi:phosphoribosyl 1,2-cyclic phosphodiesterase